jgi:hypothetical protein
VLDCTKLLSVAVCLCSGSEPCATSQILVLLSTCLSNNVSISTVVCIPKSGLKGLTIASIFTAQSIQVSTAINLLNQKVKSLLF